MRWAECRVRTAARVSPGLGGSLPPAVHRRQPNATGPATAPPIRHAAAGCPASAAGSLASSRPRAATPAPAHPPRRRTSLPGAASQPCSTAPRRLPARPRRRAGAGGCATSSRTATPSLPVRNGSRRGRSATRSSPRAGERSAGGRDDGSLHHGLAFAGPAGVFCSTSVRSSARQHHTPPSPKVPGPRPPITRTDSRSIPSGCQSRDAGTADPHPHPELQRHAPLLEAFGGGRTHCGPDHRSVARRAGTTPERCRFNWLWVRRGQCPRASPVAHGEDRSAEAPWSPPPRGDRPPHPLTGPGWPPPTSRGLPAPAHRLPGQLLCRPLEARKGSHRR